MARKRRRLAKAKQQRGTTHMTTSGQEINMGSNVTIVPRKTTDEHPMVSEHAGLSVVSHVLLVSIMPFNISGFSNCGIRRLS